MSDLPQAEIADPDGVQVALRAAQTLWSRGDTTESLRWLRRAAESASDEGADLRSLQLAKAAAELRAKLFGTSDPPSADSVRAVPTDVSGLHTPVPADAAPQYTSSSSPSEAALSDGAASEPASSERTPGSARPSGPPAQYVVHRPREATRQLMGLSSSTLEAVQREGSSYPPAPSWSADSERRVASAPPPLPRASLDDYEELEAEPEEDSSDHVESSWIDQPQGAYRVVERVHEPRLETRSEAVESSPRVPTLPPPAFQPGAFPGSFQSAGFQPGVAQAAPFQIQPALPSSPPPLPRAAAFADDDDADMMRPEQPTVLISPADEAPGIAEPPSSGPQEASSFLLQANSWEPEAPVPSWDSASSFPWEMEPRPSSWGASSSPSDGPPPPSETAPAKLTARVHHQAVRVSVAMDPRVSGQYVVRPLREGEKAPAGERVALLVALEPGQPLV